MWRVFATGIALAVGIVAADFALHLLNRPSDTAVAVGYLILLALVSVAVELFRRLRG